MDQKVETYFTLCNLVDLDKTDHKVKELATLFLNAMNDWPTTGQDLIFGFVKELKSYFGTPLSIEKINSVKFNGRNAWQVEAGSSIADMIDISTKFCGEDNFDNILKNILDLYEKEFNVVDFIAELKYKTTGLGGRKTTAKSGYRPQIKFSFEEMQTSGQQTFINKEAVSPGETVMAKIKMVSPDFFAGRLNEGMPFEFREGATIIGRGEIKQIINERLQKSN